ALAKRAKGFDMRIIYYDVYRNEDIEKKLGIQYVEFKELLKESDFVSIHVPLTSETYHLFNEEAFKSMKKTAYLINTSRGPVIDERALYKALTEGWIKGAGLDVHEEEPTPRDNPLLKLENIVVAPHLASASVETRVKMAVMAAENLVSVLKGKVPPNLVNTDVIKVRPLER
ncbi:MAG: NAD(P)-dependent oxidoreductase, partial [Candidatus Bathyarchaeia archaeon]